MSNLFWLTDAQVARLGSYFPKSHSKPRVDDWSVLSGIIFFNLNGLRWRVAPAEYCPRNPLYNRWKRGVSTQLALPAHTVSTRPKRALVAYSYRDHGVETTAVYIAHQKRWMPPALRRHLRGHKTIEQTIGHMKTDGRLARCALTGTLGDALHAVLCGCGYNIRMILAHLKALWAPILTVYFAMVRLSDRTVDPQDQPKLLTA